jgi:hypothetical protein
MTAGAIGGKNLFTQIKGGLSGSGIYAFGNFEQTWCFSLGLDYACRFLYRAGSDKN